MKSEHLQMWLIGRKRLTDQLNEIREVDLLKRVHADSNSVGWLLRHIAEVRRPLEV